MKIKKFMIWQPHRQPKGKVASTLASKTWLRRAVYKLVKLYEKLTRQKDSLPFYHGVRKKDVTARSVSVQPLDDKTGYPSLLGRGAFASVRLGREGNEFMAVKVPKKSIEDMRKDELGYIKSDLNELKEKGKITEDEYLNALPKAEQLVEEFNAPEVECQLAQESACQYVAIPEMVDGQQVMPLHGRNLRSSFTVKSPDGDNLPTPLPEIWVKKLFKQALTAVHVVHGKGIAHRDIKPDNFLVNSVGELKLTDFGLACRSAESVASVRSDKVSEAELLLLQSSSTLAYAPVDRFLYSGGDSRVGDSWALGVILVEMLTAKNYFCDLGRVRVKPPATVEKAIEEKMEGRRKALEQLETLNVDPEAIQLVRGLLETDPMKRMTVEKALGSDYLKGLDMTMNARSAPEQTPPDEVFRKAKNTGGWMNESLFLDEAREGKKKLQILERIAALFRSSS